VAGSAVPVRRPDHSAPVAAAWAEVQSSDWLPLAEAQVAAALLRPEAHSAAGD